MDDMLQKQGLDEIYRLVAGTDDQKLIADFFECLFTSAELQDIAKRWLLVKEIDKGTTQREIARIFHLHQHLRKVGTLTAGFRLPRGQLVDVGSNELYFSHRSLKRHSHIHSLVPSVTIGTEINLLLCDISILMLFVTYVISGFKDAD